MILQGQAYKDEMADIHAPHRHKISTCLEYDVNGGIHAGNFISSYGPKSGPSSDLGNEPTNKPEFHL